MLASISKITGRSLIGARDGSGSGQSLYATDPTTGQKLEPAFISASSEEVELAVRLSAEAFEVYRRVPGRERAALLRKIADKIESITSDIVERAQRETALPQARL